MFGSVLIKLAVIVQSFFLLTKGLKHSKMTFGQLYIYLACRYHAIHKEVYEWFDISFDEFGRTSTPQQTEVCQAIFQKLLDNNWLSENTMQQACV